jgi:hypothetical protein
MSLKRIFVLVAAISGVVLAAIAYIWLSDSRGADSAIGIWASQEIIREQEKGSLEGYQSPDNTIIIQIAASNANSDPTSWFTTPHLAAWKYENKRLVAATDVEVEKVIREMSAPVWVVVVRNISSDTAQVDIAVQHSRSKTVGFSGGGTAAHWKLRFLNGTWTVESSDVYYYWD